MEEARKRMRKAMKVFQEYLEKTVWFPSLKWNNDYTIMVESSSICTGEGNLRVILAKDGDVYIDIDGNGVRLRTPYGGGGTNIRTRNAAIVLAYAIKEDKKNRVMV